MQQNYIAQSKSPVFLMWLKSFLSMAVSGGYPLSKFEKFQEHEYRGRRWMWVDPQRDMAAAKVAVDNGWKTNTDIASDLGYDYEDNLETMAREKDARKKHGIEDPLLANVHVAVKDPSENEKKTDESEE